MCAKSISRRDFLKVSGIATGSVLLPTGAALAASRTPKFPLRKKIGEVPTICTYCAVGCGQIVAVEGGQVVNIEGDPDHPINQGTLCSKGAAAYQVVNNPHRLTKVKYRAPGASEWQDMPWEDALPKIARKIKDTRDANWIAEHNRTEAIAFVGGSQNTNEECYLWVKALRSMGLVYIEHQARI